MRPAYLVTTARTRRIYWGAIFLLLLSASLLGLYAYLFSPNWFQTAGLMPVALHSPLRADYSADLHGMRAISLNLGLISDAARDQAAQENDPLPELIALLQTPVPAVTSFLAATPTGQPAGSATATPAKEETSPWTPTSTRSVTLTLTFTATPSPTKTLRLLTATLTFTRTQKALTHTPTKAPPTATHVMPTSTHNNPPPTGYPPPNTPLPTGYPFP